MRSVVKRQGQDLRYEDKDKDKDLYTGPRGSSRTKTFPENNKAVIYCSLDLNTIFYHFLSATRYRFGSSTSVKILSPASIAVDVPQNQ